MKDRFKNWFLCQPVRNKVLIVVLGAVHVALLVAYIGFIIITQTMVRDFLGMVNSLGDELTGQLEQSITAQSDATLEAVCTSTADTANQKLAELKNALNECAGYAETISQSPGSYPSQELVYTDDSQDGVEAFKYTIAPGVDEESVSETRDALSGCGVIFAAKMESIPEIRKIYIGTEDGLFLDYSKLAGNQDYDPRERSWYQEAMQNPGTVTWTEPYVAADGVTQVLTLTKTLNDSNGTAFGVIAIDIALDDVLGEIVGESAETGYVTFMVGPELQIIAYPGMADNASFDTALAAHVSDVDSVVSALGISSNGVTQTALDGTQSHLAFSRLKETGWTYCLSVSDAQLYASLTEAKADTQASLESYEALWQDSARWLIIIMIAFYLIVGLVFTSATYQTSKLITEPVRKLATGIRKIGRGDFNQYIEIESKDELGEMADRFNHMQVNLMEYMQNLTAITAEKERIGAELNVATQIQANMLPRVYPAYPNHPEFDLYASMDPAKEVGGDFYDFFMIDSDHLALVIADVSGKGVPAALFMVIAKTLLKNAAQGMGADVAPSDILTVVNDQLCEGNEADLFVTVWLGILQISTGIIRAANAGHEYPAIRKPDGSFELLHDKHGFVLGGMEGLPFTSYTIELEPESSIFVYTDGVAEATDANDELYGTDRMLEALNQDPNASPDELLPTVRASVDKFVGDAPQFDDLTMLSLKYHGPMRKDA